MLAQCWSTIYDADSTSGGSLVFAGYMVDNPYIDAQLLYVSHIAV